MEKTDDFEMKMLQRMSLKNPDKEIINPKSEEKYAKKVFNDLVRRARKKDALIQDSKIK